MPLVSQFLNAERITVIAADFWKKTSDDRVVDVTTFEEKVAIAEGCRSHLINLQTEAARKKAEENAKLLTDEGNNTEAEESTEGRKNNEVDESNEG